MASAPRPSSPLPERMPIASPPLPPTSFSSHPDTSSASSSSDIPHQSTQKPSTPHHQVSSPLSHATLDYFPEPPHSGISPSSSTLTATTAPTAAAAVPSPSRQSVSSIKRKPLSSTASPLATRFSQGSASSHWPAQIDLPTPSARFSRSTSIDSPTFYEYTAASSVVSRPLPFQSSAPAPSSEKEVGLGTSRIPGNEDSPASQAELLDVLSDYDDSASDLTRDADQVKTRAGAFEQERAASASGTSRDDNHNNTNIHDDNDNEDDEDDDDDDDEESTYSSYLDRTQSPAPPMFATKPTPPHLQLDKVDRPQSSDGSTLRSSTVKQSPSSLNKPLPKSPSATSPFATFFGWGNSPSVTEFSSVASPLSPVNKASANDTTHERANVSSTNTLQYFDSYLSTPPPSSSQTLAYVEEMEDELKAISSELASSIRRELDLEDLVDRLQETVNNSQAPSKRTSDYFSDSGYGSAKLSEADQTRDEIDKIQRRSEQEKASLRLDLTNKLQDERSRRKELDAQIKELAERASQMDLAQINNLDASDRVTELENTCEDLRRRLSEERSSKANFEDLLSALKGELQSACNERDNLRDEVLPQLRARVEGLESEASEYANLTYESTKMQQELYNLKQENMTLRRGSVASVEQLTRGSRTFSTGLSRSNSVAASSQLRSQRPPMGLSRSNSIKAGQGESRDQLADRLKDVEQQRDALHGALKNLLERQEFQSREYEKRIRLLETERDRLLAGPSKKGGFEREVLNLRTEINVLRRRAEEALDQKWQVEKGLSGLKMDLDRAEGEVAALRELLNEKDILIPETLSRASGSSDGFGGEVVTSESLQLAYEKLQTAYADSLERIKQLEANIETDEKTQAAVQRLQKALSTAITERDSLQNRYDTAYESEIKSVEAESALTEELCESARQVESLASQVRQQLAANAELRQRLANAVSRGDADRLANNDRITILMERLGELEDELVTAQTSSEDRVSRHEEEVFRLRDAHNGHLRRMDGSSRIGGLRSPALKSTRTTTLLSPVSSSLFPEVLNNKSFEDAADMKGLRAKVSELERALSDAELEMQEVVARMSTAQVEVMNLQEERDAAVRETRRLQKLLEKEEMKTFEERFKTLGGL